MVGLGKGTVGGSVVVASDPGNAVYTSLATVNSGGQHEDRWARGGSVTVGLRISKLGSIRAPQPTVNRARLKHITQTGCAAHGWNIEIRAADQRAEQSNERNERRHLIVEIDSKEGTTIITQIGGKRASGEIIRGEQMGVGRASKHLLTIRHLPPRSLGPCKLAQSWTSPATPPPIFPIR